MTDMTMAVPAMHSCYKVFVLTMGIVLSGCSNSSTVSYNVALKDAQTVIPFAVEFDTVFPESYSVLQRYTGTVGPSVFSMKTSIHDRYVFRLDIPVTLDNSRRKVIKYGEPAFQLVEVTEVSRKSILYNPKSQIRFGKVKWRTIFSENGDFNSIGVDLDNSNPVPGFADMWRKNPTAF